MDYNKNSTAIASSKQAFLQAFAGLLILAIVMGIGRFSYTALLPYMMEHYHINEKTAGTMAAWNYTGYLIGTLAIFKVKSEQWRLRLLFIFTILNILTTSLMGIIHTVPLWNCIRFISGFSSGVCFVLCSALILDRLLQLKKPIFSGFIYSGVGIGIALSGICTQLLVTFLGVDTLWIMMGVLCIPLLIIAFFILTTKNKSTITPASPKEKNSTLIKKRTKKGYSLLLFIYFLEGFGYIIGMTFLVSLVKTSTGSVSLANITWIITGVAAAISAPLWRFAAKSNYQRTLILALLLQTIGSFLPVLSNAPIVILCGAFLLGGTFMGITTLSLQYATTLSSKPSTYIVAILTAIYGIGQILGPLLTGLVADGKGFDFGFLMSASALLLATILLAINYFINIMKKE